MVCILHTTVIIVLLNYPLPFRRLWYSCEWLLCAQWGQQAHSVDWSSGLSRGRQAYLTLQGLLVGFGRVRDAGVCLYENLSFYGLSGAVHWVRCAHVPWALSGKMITEQVLTLKAMYILLFVRRVSLVTGATWRPSPNATRPIWQQRICRCHRFQTLQSKLQRVRRKLRSRRMWICFSRCACCRRANPMATMSMLIARPNHSYRIRLAWRPPPSQHWQPAARRYFVCWLWCCS